MKSTMYALLTAAASVSVSMAQTNINTSFTSPYTNGDLAGQQGWSAIASTGTNAFQITDTGGTGFADTVPTVLNTNLGNYVYLNTASIGNAANDEWDGVMDFTLSVPTNSTSIGGDVFRLALSPDASIGIGLTNEVPIRLNSSTGGNITINSSGGATGSGITVLPAIAASVMGWVPASTNSADWVTDMWRLSWKIRKTSATDVYSMTCSMQNLTNPTTFTSTGVYLTKPSTTYGAAGLDTVMGRPTVAEFDGQGNSVNITIDHLRIVKTASQPVKLYPTTVNAVADNAVVDLSWPVVYEALDYDVKRADTIDGIYSTLDTITTNFYSDATVVNGNIYYYKITSKNGAVTADSAVVAGEPDSPTTGTIIDTTFSAAEGYIDGDLAGQDRWKAIAVTGPNAFNVISSGDGFAETKTFSNDFSNVLDRQVYYSKSMLNDPKNQWSGTVKFRFEATPNEGLYATNALDSVTNIQNIARLTRGLVYDFGLTADTSAAINPKNGTTGSPKDDVLINVRLNNAGVIGSSGQITIGLNADPYGNNNMLTLNRQQVGWDPEWIDDNSTNAPDFDTEWITLDYTIRKTELTDTYSANVVVTVGTNVYTGNWQYTDAADGANTQPTVAYNAQSLRFAMGHSKQANGVAVNPPQTNGIVHVNLDSVSLTHAETSEIYPEPPYGITTVPGSLQFTLNWNGGFEAESFDVFRSSTSPDGVYTVIDNVPASTKTYLNTGLQDLRTYFYKLKANYPAPVGASDYSTMVTRRAQSVTTLPQATWAYYAIVTPSGGALTMSATTMDGIVNRIGNGVDGSVIPAAQTYYTEVSPLLRGVLQTYGASTVGKNLIVKPTLSTHTGDRMRLQVDSVSGSNPTNSSLYWVEIPSVNAAGKVISFDQDGGSMHPAIRNGSQWYVCPSVTGATIIDDITLVNWAELTLATETSTTMMTVTGAPALPRTFNDITAIGIFRDSIVGNSVFEHFRLISASLPTAYDEWTDGYGIYNEDAAKTNDYDEDGFDNAWEWGLNGDPADPSKTGVGTAELMRVGGNMVYIYPRLKSADRPDYYLTESDNLQYTAFTDQESTYTITSGGTWTNQPKLEAVTNMIPTDSSVKFIKLNIE